MTPTPFIEIPGGVWIRMKEHQLGLDGRLQAAGWFGKERGLQGPLCWGGCGERVWQRSSLVWRSTQFLFLVKTCVPHSLWVARETVSYGMPSSRAQWLCYLVHRVLTVL